MPLCQQGLRLCGVRRRLWPHIHAVVVGSKGLQPGPSNLYGCKSIHRYGWLASGLRQRFQTENSINHKLPPTESAPVGASCNCRLLLRRDHGGCRGKPLMQVDSPTTSHFSIVVEANGFTTSETHASWSATYTTAAPAL